MGVATEGRFPTGQPYLRLGAGPPLFVLPGLTPEHKNPTGAWRRFSLSWCAPFAEHFTVYLVQRRTGLPRAASMSDIAGDYAEVIRNEVGGPVHVHGTSTGGSVALQLATDHPDLVQRMVVAAAACRLGEEGRRFQSELLRFMESGDARGAAATMTEALVPRRLARAGRGAGWLLGNLMAPDDPSDMNIVLAAEDVFDVEEGLKRITAPTLVQGGGADRFYSEDLFRRTADGIPAGRAVVYAGRAHTYPVDNKLAAGTALGFLLAG